jgi:hypothetical protein
MRDSVRAVVYQRAQDLSYSGSRATRLTPGAALIVASLLSAGLWGAVFLIASSLISTLSVH